MPTALTHCLLPTAILILANPNISRKVWIKMTGICFLLANAPDLDLIPAFLWFAEGWKDVHREWGHNVFSCAVLTSAGMILIRKICSPNISRKNAWIISSFLIVSHLILDAMTGADTAGIRPGVPLLWPFSDWEWTLPFAFFKVPNLSPHHHPLIGLIQSSNMWHLILRELIFLLSAAVIWIGADVAFRFLFPQGFPNIFKKIENP